MSFTHFSSFKLCICDFEFPLNSCTYESIRYHISKFVCSSTDFDFSYPCIFHFSISSNLSDVPFESQFLVSDFHITFPKGFRRYLLLWLHSFEGE